MKYDNVINYIFLYGFIIIFISMLLNNRSMCVLFFLTFLLLLVVLYYDLFTSILNTSHCVMGYD